MSRKPNNFQILKSLSDRMDILANEGKRESVEFKELQDRFYEIKNMMPKYRPHVWRKNGL